MSVKRQATTELNHDNWDQDDPSEHEEMGSFKTAPKEELEKRVIRTAKRRSQASLGDQAKKSVFSGFGGFNKSQPSSFDFLSKLANGSQTTSNGSSGSGGFANSPFTSTLSTSTAANNSSPFSNTLTTSTSSMFSRIQTSVFENVEKADVVPETSDNTPKASLFGANIRKNTNTSSSQSEKPVASPLFGTYSATPNKSGPSNKPENSTVFGSLSSSNNSSENTSNSTPVNPSSVFGTFINTSNKSPFTSTANSSLFMSQQSKSSPISIQNNNKTAEPARQDNKDVSNKVDSKKIKYCSKIRGLNEAVLDWIKKHVEEQPICILSPIFNDYERYLKDIQDEYSASLNEDDNKCKTDTTKTKDKSAVETNLSNNYLSNNKTGLFSGNNNVNNLPKESNSNTDCNPNSKVTEAHKDVFQSQASTVFTSPFNKTSSEDNGAIAPKFSFGITTSSTTITTNSEFSFGINKSSAAPISGTPTFTFKPNTPAVNTSAAITSTPFSFGNGKPFSFSTNVHTPTENKNENKEDEEEPPKVEFTPVVEENSIFDKKCKIFVKKDGNFIDKGVGTLYIKKVEDSGKHQLLVRANTNLGNILVNLILTSGIPSQRMGKNNVMMVCIPTPDAKPPPTPILIRVKTAEEADELLEILNKYKS